MSKRVIVLDECFDCPYSVDLGQGDFGCYDETVKCPDFGGVPDDCPFPSIEDIMDAHCGNCEHFRVYERFEDEPVCCNGASKYSAQPMDESDVCEEWEAIKDE